MQPFGMKRPSQQVQAEIKFLFKRKASPVTGLKVKYRLQLILASILVWLSKFYFRTIFLFGGGGGGERVEWG